MAVNEEKLQAKQAELEQKIEEAQKRLAEMREELEADRQEKCSLSGTNLSIGAQSSVILK